MSEPVFSYADRTMPAVRRGLIRLVEAATGQRRLRRLYLDARRAGALGPGFFAAAVRGLRLDVRFDAEALAAVPRSGPLVVVANHPYGVLDGIVISWLVGQVRPDFLVMTHAALLRAPEVRPHVLAIDFAPTAEATRTNLASRAAARRHLDGGGCIVVFPAGGISTAPDRLGRGPAVDAPWQPFVAQLIQRSRAAVVPMRFAGQNSRLFQVASHVSPTLRLSLIFREVRGRIGSVLPVAVGRAIPFAALPTGVDRQALVDHLRAVTLGLAVEQAIRPGLAAALRRRAARGRDAAVRLGTRARQPLPR